MEIKSYKNRNEVPDNDIALINKDDMVKALKTLSSHWEEMFKELKSEGNNGEGFSSCSEQIKHLLQDIKNC